MGLRDLTVNLRNILLMGKLKGVTVLNTVEALGTVPDAGGAAKQIERLLALWGSDPIHPSPAAYRLLAAKIAERVEAILYEPASPNQGGKRKADLHDAWVAGSQSVAKRAGLQQTRRGGQARGAARAKQ